MMLLSLLIISFKFSVPAFIFTFFSSILSSICFFNTSMLAFSSSYYLVIILTSIRCDFSNDSFLELMSFHILSSSSCEQTLNFTIGFPALSEMNGAYKFLIVLLCALAIELYDSSIFLSGSTKDRSSHSPSASTLESTSILSRYSLSLPTFSRKRLATSSKWAVKGTLKRASETFLNSASSSFCSSGVTEPST
eukprot:TRINITY_DN9593_c0_g1_i14.p1 TRINITY_DN9593_c0_g1~~TRINITY_DN9593_c0_g1_i14.p1  ORF type:complete len:193 (-),score=3.19 TRINITY_DN9593_c0_g1_i14:435-1013(-)